MGDMGGFGTQHKGGPGGYGCQSMRVNHGPPKARVSSPILGCHLCPGIPEGNPRVSTPHSGLPKIPPVHRDPSRSHQAHLPILRKPPLTLWTRLPPPRTTCRPQVLGSCGVLGCCGVLGPPDSPHPAGIEPQGNVVLRPAQFTVETLEAGMGEVIVYVEDPEGHTEEVQEALAPLWGIPPVSLSGRPPQCPALCHPLSPFLGSLPTPGQGGPQQ